MKKIFTFCLSFMALSVLLAQNATTVSLTGLNSNLNATFNTNTVVDSTLIISSNGTIDGFKVQISQSYTAGDLLIAPSSLPSGISSSFNSSIGVLTFVGTATASQWQIILRAVQFKSSSAACFPTLREITFVAGKVFYNPLTQHFYEAVAASGTWGAAKSAAQLRSYFGKVGYLATMQSGAENNFIWKIMSTSAWMGASDKFDFINTALGTATYANQGASENKWHWVTGPEAGTQFSNGTSSFSGQYENWNGGEPNNSGGEHVAQFYSANSGTWNDLRTTSVQGSYLVEYGGMPNDITTNTPISSRPVAVSGSSSGSIQGGGVNVCAGSNSTTLSVSGLTGTVVRWESSLDNFFTNGTTIANTALSYTASNITQTTYYRAVVNATSPNACSGLKTSSTAITVQPTIAGNVTALNSTICAGGTAQLVLSGNQGSVVKWQTSANNTTWTDIVNTTNSLNQTVTTAGTAYFRAVVQTSGCGSALNTNSKAITVNTGNPPIGGVLNDVLICHPSATNGTLTLTSYTGSIQKWQKSTNQGVVWTDILNTSSTLSLTNISTEVQYRVVLVNGTCGLAYSAVGKARLSSGLTASTAEIQSVSCSGGNNGIALATASGGISPYTYSWSNSATTDSILNLVAGAYTATVTDANGCTSVSSATITVTAATNTAATASSTPTLCINTALTNITHATTGATGIGSANGLPSGVTVSWASDVITITGTPTAVGTWTYFIPLTGGCGTVNATGTITVTAANTAATASSTPTLCINTALTNITHATTGATGIGSANGLPAGVTATWAGNTITITGTPTAAGTFSYSIPLTGGCGIVNATGTITVTAVNTAAAASSTPTLCINTALTNITHATTGATGIGSANGLPAGVTAAWAGNIITITGTPTAAGTFSYSR